MSGVVIEPRLFIFILSTLLAAAMPVVFVFVRHAVRLQRLRILDRFDHTFDSDPGESHPETAAPRSESFKKGIERPSKTPSFDNVREKYTEDIISVSLNNIRNPMAILQFLHKKSWLSISSTWIILAASLPYIAVGSVGFYVLILCGENFGFCATLPVAFLYPENNAGAGYDAALVHNTLTIAAAAFLGAYLFTLGTLSRAVATFDLSPMTMLRVAIHVITGVVGSVVAYRAFPDIVAVGQAIIERSPVEIRPPGLPSYWIGVAFLFGLMPDLVVGWLIKQAQAALAKASASREVRIPKPVPLDIIDGIDFFTRFRLQQSDIYEVQALATANPIMMFVETPYGIYQCIDWVAQAQLCCVVGPERFLTLQAYNIRTIFDLERGMLSRSTTSQMRRFLTSLMLTNPVDDADRKGSRFWTLWRDRSEQDSDLVASDKFGAYLAQLFSEPAVGTDGRQVEGDPDRTMKHLARLAVDDLQVHRLRQVWQLVYRRLDVDQDRLPDTERAPEA